MGHYEDIKIDRSEGWKYSNTHGTSGDDYHARVYVDDKGEISKDSSFRLQQIGTALQEDNLQQAVGE